MGPAKRVASLLFRDGGIGADLLDLGNEALALCGLGRPLQASPQMAHLALSPLLSCQIALWLTSHCLFLPPDSRRNLRAYIAVPSLKLRAQILIVPQGHHLRQE